MKRLMTAGLSTIGLAAVAIAPALTLTEVRPTPWVSLSPEVGLTDRFDDSFINGPGGINSLTDDFDDSFINGPGGLNS